MVTCGLFLPARGIAQSAQPYSVQASAFTTGILVNNGTLGGFGAEGQFRLNRLKSIKATGGPLSLGIGAQFTSHKSSDNYTLRVAGIFIEPRVVIDVGSARVFPYLSARLAALRQSSDFASSTSGAAVGLGGGVAYKLTQYVNLDAGLAGVYQNFSDARTSGGNIFQFGSLASYAAKIGVNIGLR